MVRILAVSDETVESLWRTSVRRYAPDLVIAAGDLPWDYLEFLASALDVPMVFVPGNHDLPLPDPRRRSHGLGRDLLADPRPHGAVDIDLSVVDVAGLRIAGLGGCVRYRPGPHQYTQREYQRRAGRLVRTVRRRQRKVPGPVDILVTHAPPYRLGDDEDRPHVGIEALHGVIDVLRPEWLLHGHIHPHGRTMPDRIVRFEGERRTTLRNVIPFRVLDVKSTSALIRDGVRGRP